jgi:hypothetical protein
MENAAIITDGQLSSLLDQVGRLSDELRKRRSQGRLEDGSRMDRQSLRELEREIQAHWSEIRAIRGGVAPEEALNARRSKWE